MGRPKKDPAAVKPKVRSLNEKQLAEEPKRQLRINSKAVLEELWLSLQRRLKADDPRAAELVARMFAYDKAPGGVSIYNQGVQISAPAQSPGGKIISFDQLIGRIESREGARVISQADDDVLIPDAEFEDITPIDDAELADIEEAAGGVPD